MKLLNDSKLVYAKKLCINNSARPRMKWLKTKIIEKCLTHKLHTKLQNLKAGAGV